MPLIAYLEDETRKGGEDASAAPLTFFLIGLGGAVLALILFDQAWKERFRSVRKTLVFCCRVYSVPGDLASGGRSGEAA